jgi:hypothetical protein
MRAHDEWSNVPLVSSFPWFEDTSDLVALSIEYNLPLLVHTDSEFASLRADSDVPPLRAR